MFGTLQTKVQPRTEREAEIEKKANENLSLIPHYSSSGGLRLGSNSEG